MTGGIEDCTLWITALRRHEGTDARKEVVRIQQSAHLSPAKEKSDSACRNANRTVAAKEKGKQDNVIGLCESCRLSLAGQCAICLMW